MISVGQSTESPSVVCLINLLWRPKVAHDTLSVCVCVSTYMWMSDVRVPDCAYLSACVTCFSICSCVFFNVKFYIKTHTTCCFLNIQTSSGNRAAGLANKFCPCPVAQWLDVVTDLPDGP